MNINKINSTAINFIKPAIKKVPVNSVCDSFEKSVSNIAESLNKKFASLMGIDDIPVYKKAEDFKKPLLGFIGSSQEKQAYLYNSSEQVQAKTKESIQSITQYIEEEVKCGNATTVYNSIGTKVCEFKNGLIVDAYEPHNVFCNDYTPLKTLTLKMKDSNEKITLPAYSTENDHLIYNIMNIFDSIGKKSG